MAHSHTQPSQGTPLLHGHHTQQQQQSSYASLETLHSTDQESQEALARGRGNYHHPAAATLKRGLQARHLVMMSVGGTIGTGLFVASGLSVATAGPAGALVGYSVVGIMVYFVLGALGEMSTLMPVSGSFHEFAGRFVDPALAWTLGWNYWLQWAVSLPSELAAAGIIMSFWFPSIPSWIFSFIILIILLFINTQKVSNFGEAEYWLSFIKVAAVIVFIAVGLYVDVTGFPTAVDVLNQSPVGFKNWFIEGAPFKNGVEGIFAIVSIAFFGFGGTELVGVSAGEVEEPRKNVPKAINQTFWRILIFYIGSIGIIGLLIPNNDPSLTLSAANDDIQLAPFTLILRRSGLISAAHIMNLVILSAVVSAANSAMYAASRTLMAMAERGHAPGVLGKVDRNGVPWLAVGLTTGISGLAFLGIIWGDGQVFSWLVTLTGTSGLLTWMSISVTHLRFRKAFMLQKRSVDELPFHAVGMPFGNYVAIFIGIVIICGQGYTSFITRPFDPKSMVSVFLGVPLFVTLYLGYKYFNKTQFVALEDCDFGDTSSFV